MHLAIFLILSPRLTTCYERHDGPEPRLYYYEQTSLSLHQIRLPMPKLRAFSCRVIRAGRWRRFGWPILQHHMRPMRISSPAFYHTACNKSPHSRLFAPEIPPRPAPCSARAAASPQSAPAISALVVDGLALLAFAEPRYVDIMQEGGFGMPLTSFDYGFRVAGHR